MRPILILCIILSGQQISRAQLNFEGNPLTEGTEYKAEESHVSGRNVRQDYQRFEVADGRTFGASKSPFTLSPVGDIATPDKQHSSTSNVASKKDQLASSVTINRSTFGADRLPNVRSSSEVSSKYQISISKLNESRTLDHSSENLPKVSQPQPETRQLHQHSIQQQHHLPYESASRTRIQSNNNAIPHESASRIRIQSNNNAVPHQLASRINIQSNNNAVPHESRINIQSNNKAMPHESASRINIQSNNIAVPHESRINIQSNNNAMPHESASRINIQSNNKAMPHESASRINIQSNNNAMPHESASRIHIQSNNNAVPHESRINIQSNNNAVPHESRINIQSNNNAIPHESAPRINIQSNNNAVPHESRINIQSNNNAMPHESNSRINIQSNNNAMPHESNSRINIQSNNNAVPHESTSSSQNIYTPPEQSQVYTPTDPTLQQQHNANIYNTLAASPVNLASNEALNKFLNSRTPEESQMALQHYLTIREQAARGLQGFDQMDGNEPVREATKENNLQTQWVDSSSILNDHTNDEYLAFNQQENTHRHHLLSGVVPSKVVQDETGLMSYSPVQQSALPRIDNLDLQSRQNMPPLIGPVRQRPRYRGQLPARYRGRPWVQSRIDPRPFAYNHKGPVYGPPGPPPGFGGKGKPPVEVIYTRPPGFGHGPSHPSNPPVPYEDASHWFPDADQPPPHKDVYYSQLYQQSYDPHYYNYIAKTGKIKPWLYGKLGKHEEKSIWWELFAGFKKHGMKNMMNPMFLLGMTIPTLTIMLTALIQKRSLGRSDSQGFNTEEVIDELVQRIQQHIACYEKRIKNEEGSEEKCW